MLFKEKRKELIICMLSLLALTIVITTNVFATTSQDLESLLQNSNKQQINYIPSNNTVNNKVNNTVNNTTNNTVNNTVNNTNKTNNTTPTTHADAGLDQSVLFIIAICGISAVYAYKKIREY